jgi:uncharacterized MAPEG superfamily protein
MTVPFWCLFVGVLLPYVWAFSRFPFVRQQLGEPDNKQPREQAAKLTGKGARAVAAQENAWEALTIFAPAVLVNHLAGGDQGSAPIVCMVWVVARLLHGVFYIADIDLARSGVFAVGLICTITLFVQAAIA